MGGTPVDFAEFLMFLFLWTELRRASVVWSILSLEIFSEDGLVVCLFNTIFYDMAVLKFYTILQGTWSPMSFGITISLEADTSQHYPFLLHNSKAAVNIFSPIFDTRSRLEYIWAIHYFFQSFVRVPVWIFNWFWKRAPSILTSKIHRWGACFWVKPWFWIFRF